MGRDKAFLPHHGRPLWWHQAETLRQAGVTRLLISCRREQPLAEPATQWSAAHSMQIQLVFDPEDGGGGVLGAVTRCLQTSGQGLLFLTVDMPLVDATILAPLWPHTGQDNGGFWATARGIEPFPGYFPLGLLPALEDALAQDRPPSLTRLLENARARGQVRAAMIPAESAWRLANWNRPEDTRAPSR